MPRTIEAFLLFWLPRVDVAQYIKAKRDAAQIAALEAKAVEIEARHTAACQRELARMWDRETIPEGNDRPVSAARETTL